MSWIDTVHTDTSHVPYTRRRFERTTGTCSACTHNTNTTHHMYHNTHTPHVHTTHNTTCTHTTPTPHTTCTHIRTTPHVHTQHTTPHVHSQHTTDVTCDVVASLRVDSSKCFSLTHNETCVVRCSAGCTRVDDKNTPEFTGDSDGHVQGSLECAEESLELSTVRTLAEGVLPWNEHFVEKNGRNSGANDSGLLSVAKGSSWTTIMEVADKTIVRRQVAGVSCRLRVVHALNQRARGWESPSNTSVWSANEGLRGTDGTRGGRFPIARARRFVVRASAREELERHGTRCSSGMTEADEDTCL